MRADSWLSYLKSYCLFYIFIAWYCFRYWCVLLNLKLMIHKPYQFWAICTIFLKFYSLYSKPTVKKIDRKINKHPQYIKCAIYWVVKSAMWVHKQEIEQWRSVLNKRARKGITGKSPMKPRCHVNKETSHGFQTVPTTESSRCCG